MNMKKYGNLVLMLAAGVVLLLQNVYASEIQKAIESSSTASFESFEAFMAMIIGWLEGNVAYLGAFAFLVGILICFAGAPLKKYRGAGYACLGAAAVAFMLWLLLPTLITTFGGGAAAS